MSDASQDFDGKKDACEIMRLSIDVWECFECGAIAFGNRKDSKIRWYYPTEKPETPLMEMAGYISDPSCENEEDPVDIAVLAERERCAKIAEETPVVLHYNTGVENRTIEDARATKRRIAEKIRSGA